MKLLKIAFIITAILISFTATAQHTTRGRLKRPVRTESYDTIKVTVDNCADSLIHITGYEKPLLSSRETIFMRNYGQSFLESVQLEITYKTIDSKEMHKRTIMLSAQIPPGERRMLTFKSWDINRLFYYHLNVPNTSKQATPYTVTIRPLQLHYHRK